MEQVKTTTENVNEIAKAKKLNATIKTAKVTQSGNEELGMKEKVLYYLVIENEKGRLQLNVGEKTYTEVKKITEGV